MSSLSVISGICTASAFLGLLSLIGYWLATLQFQKKERSIRAVVEGDGVFDTDRAVDILGEFQSETWKLEALRVLANHDLQKATRLLQKVKSRVDLTRFNAHALRTRLLTLKISAVTFLVIAGVGLVHSLATPQVSSMVEADKINGGPTERSSVPAIPIIINNNIAPPQAAENLQKTQQLASPTAAPDSAITPPLTNRDGTSKPSPIHDPPSDEDASHPVHRPESALGRKKALPRPVPRRTQSNSPRCESLLQRSSLGDSLSSDEQTELRNCM